LERKNAEAKRVRKLVKLRIVKETVDIPWKNTENPPTNKLKLVNKFYSALN
jgi:hypothetical protein